MSETAPIMATPRVPSRVPAQVPVQAAPPKADSVQQAIARASDKLGVDFGYMLAQAKVESSLDADAKARTSSASGLFQFIESTWLATMQRHGAAHGYGAAAAAITDGPRGPRVADPMMRGQILAMRNDPQAASLMAGALAQDNAAALKSVLGREPDAGELYLAHFLGSGGASRFLSALQTSPDAPAATLFPKPAAANRGIFFTQGGAPRSLQGVMDLMRGKIERAMPAGGASAAAGLPVAGTQAVYGSLPVPTAQANFADAARSFAPASYNSRPLPSGAPQGVLPATRLPKISDLLKDSFSLEASQSAGSAGDHARRAYSKLKAFGL